MNGNISDFKIAEHLLKLICSAHNVKFIDLPIKIEPENISESFLNGDLYVGETKNLPHTIYKIIINYVKNADKILKVQLFDDKESYDNFSITLSTFLRGLIEDPFGLYENDYELSLQKLYQRPLIWIIMKDIICPIYDVSLKNINVVTGNTPYIDVSKFYEENELKSENYEFIFINEPISSIEKNVFMLIEAIKAHNLCPYTVINNILSSDLRDKLEGILLISLSSKDKVDEFFCVLTSILNIKYLDDEEENLNVKEAQAGGAEHSTSWWYLGLIEQQLENVRGSDWSTHFELEPEIQELWEKVEKIKKEREKRGNKDGIPFNVLLRLKTDQTVGYQPDHSKTLQELLSSQRIW